MGFCQCNEVSQSVSTTSSISSDSSIAKHSIISLFSQSHLSSRRVVRVSEEITNLQLVSCLSIQTTCYQNTWREILQTVFQRYLKYLEYKCFFLTHIKPMSNQSIWRFINLRVNAIYQEFILEMVQTRNLLTRLLNHFNDI